MNEQANNTRILLIFQMKRTVELLEKDIDFVYRPEFAELERKMHEIRRDSIRFIKELKPWRQQ